MHTSCFYGVYLLPLLEVVEQVFAFVIVHGAGCDLGERIVGLLARLVLQVGRVDVES